MNDLWANITDTVNDVIDKKIDMNQGRMVR